MFASGGRISELASLQRGERFLVTDRSGDVSLYPHKHFLAKNEKPQNRRPPIKLHLLGDSNPLCPVTTLQQLLRRTSSYLSGSLFLDPTSKRPLTSRCLSRIIVQLIKRGDPLSVPHSHDLRKLAASLAFASNYSVEEIATSTGWTNNRTFFRHYLKHVESPGSSIQSAGIIIRPQDMHP